MATSDKPKLWTGPFTKMCLVNLFVFLNFHSFLPTFPFFVRHLGGDAMAIGVATALFSIAAIVSRPFVGWLVDTRGRRLMLVAGLAGLALLPMGYLVSGGIAVAVALRTLNGAFHASASNAAATWATDMVPRTRMGEGLGMFGLSTSLSTAVAPALALALMDGLGFSSVFLLASAEALVALGLCLSTGGGGRTTPKQALRARDLLEPMAVPAAVTFFLFMMAFGVVEVYTAIYAHENGLPGGGVFFTFMAVATLLTRILFGRVVDRHGEARMVQSGNGACLAGIILLVTCHNAPCFLLSAACMGYGFGAMQPSLQAMAVHAVTEGRRGAANSTFFMAFDLGIALGGFMAGALAKTLGYDTMFLLMSLACALSLAYYQAFARRHASSFNPGKRQPPGDGHRG